MPVVLFPLEGGIAVKHCKEFTVQDHLDKDTIQKLLALKARLQG